MKQTIGFREFEQAFCDMDRMDNFSFDGLCALFDYLEECEDELNAQIELDVIALCRDFQELQNIKQFNDSTGKTCKNLGEIKQYTSVIPILGTERFIIYQL